MKKFLFAAVAIAALGLAAPASAQIYFGAGPSGVGIGVDRGYSGHGYYGGNHGYYGGSRGYYGGQRGYSGAYAYANECRVIRSRVVTHNGRVIVRARRICN